MAMILKVSKSSQACETDLHEAGDAHDGLVGLVEHFPPREDAAGRPTVVHLLRQEVGNVGHGPVGVGQLSVEQLGSDVVLQQRLEFQVRICPNLHTETFNRLTDIQLLIRLKIQLRYDTKM